MSASQQYDRYKSSITSLDTQILNSKDYISAPKLDSSYEDVDRTGVLLRGRYSTERNRENTPRTPFSRSLGRSKSPASNKKMNNNEKDKHFHTEENQGDYHETSPIHWQTNWIHPAADKSYERVHPQAFSVRNLNTSSSNEVKISQDKGTLSRGRRKKKY